MLSQPATLVLLFLLLSIGTPLTMDEFGWTRTQAVLYNSICYAGLAVIAILSFVAVKLLTIRCVHYYKDVHVHV